VQKIGFWSTLGHSSGLTGPQWQSSLARSPGYEAGQLVPIMSSQYAADMQGHESNVVKYILRGCHFLSFSVVRPVDTVLQVAVSHSFIDTLSHCFVSI
jgi:hypothetical protein